MAKYWTALNYAQLYLYTEMAGEHGSFFIEIPYRSWSAYTGGGAAGFSDLNVGTKSVLLDSEFLLLTFQFKTYIPTGDAGAGLGTGHVSLEPTLLSALKLTPEAYLQSQLSEWIPIGGDTHYQGSILHYHFSFNQDLYRIAPSAPIIGTLEFNGWSFQGGEYTDPVSGTKGAGHDSYFSIGPGLRMVWARNLTAAWEPPSPSPSRIGQTNSCAANSACSIEIGWYANPESSAMPCSWGTRSERLAAFEKPVVRLPADTACRCCPRLSTTLRFGPLVGNV